MLNWEVLFFLDLALYRGASIVSTDNLAGYEIKKTELRRRNKEFRSQKSEDRKSSKFKA